MEATVTWQEWQARSQAGEVCGILGCRNQPTTKCEHCGNHYCDADSWVIGGPGHPTAIDLWRHEDEEA